MNPEEIKQLQEYLDGRLTPEDREQVESKLASSVELRQELDALQQSDEALIESVHGITMPEEARERLKSALQKAMGTSTRSPEKPKGRLILLGHPVLSIAALLVLAIGITLLFQPNSVALPTVISEVHKTCMKNQSEYTFTQANPSGLMQYLESIQVEYTEYFTDLKKYGFSFIGGFIEQQGSREIVNLVFSDDQNQIITSQLFVGSLDSLSGEFSSRIEGGRKFLVAQKGITTMTFWQHGDLVLVISSCIDGRRAIEIAVDKARSA